MNISYEISKDIKTKYPRTNKNRFTRNLPNLFNLLNPHTPLQNGIRAQQFKKYGRSIY